MSFFIIILHILDGFHFYISYFYQHLHSFIIIFLRPSTRLTIYILRCLVYSVVSSIFLTNVGKPNSAHP